MIQRQGKAVEQNGDLTGIPVSNTSRTYLNAAYEHMDDEILLGYQAGVTSFHNGRQDIEAGIEETLQVFYLHRIKVRSEPVIYLQEAMTIFAANFIRWASV